jgi:hypothetical protein
MKRGRGSVGGDGSRGQDKRSLNPGAQRQRPWYSESSGQHGAGDVVMASVQWGGEWEDDGLEERNTIRAARRQGALRNFTVLSVESSVG